MIETKAEIKVSSKSMEAAMVARLFKDAMESEDPIVGHFVWIRDDGQKLDLGRPVVHPSFPNKAAAMRRLETRIGQWVSGEKPGLDRNAIARLELSGATPFDLSMESFEKAALGDDGTLVIAVGHTKGVGREPMELGRVARLMLFAKNGSPIGRRQALVPIREIIQIQKRERAAQTQRLEKQEKQIEEGVDFGRQLSQEEDRQWEDVSREAQPAPAPAPWDKPEREKGVDPAERAKMMMDMALGAVGRNMGGSLNAQPLPYAEARAAVEKGPARLGVHDDFASAFEQGEDDGDDEGAGHGVGAPRAAAPDVVAQNVVAQKPAEAAARAAAQIAPVAVAVPAALALELDAKPGAARLAAGGLGSQVRAEELGAPIDPLFIRAVFPDLPEGCDEIHVTIEKKMLFCALEALEAHGPLEMRLASKGESLLALGLCVPFGKLKMLSEFIASFSKGGVMIKRGQAKAAEAGEPASGASGASGAAVQAVGQAGG